MNRVAHAWLVVRAVFELARYDVTYALLGFSGIRRQLERQVPIVRRFTVESEQQVCDAVLLATCLYWKRVLCLQRSVCTVRLLRGRGVVARLVIGFRPLPFFSHAWVEVDSRVVNDSPMYSRRLRVLHTM